MKTPRKVVGRLALSVVFFITIFAGLIDTYRVTRFPIHSHEMYSVEELGLAEWAKNETPSSSVWLTGDQHNHWLFNLTGRQPLMTYRGWLWTHGYKYRSVETDQIKLFQFPRENQHLFDKYAVKYIVVGPNEREVWKANEKELLTLFPVVKQTTHFVIFERQLPSTTP